MVFCGTDDRRSFSDPFFSISVSTTFITDTIHNLGDAATAIPRLTDMGVEPFLVASTVNVIIALNVVMNGPERSILKFIKYWQTAQPLGL